MRLTLRIFYVSVWLGLIGLLPATPALAQTGCAPSLSEGLQVWLPLDETIGTNAVDASGRGYKGETSSYDATWQPAGGSNRGALALANYAYLRLPLYWQPATFTISWWVKPSAFGNYSQTISAKVPGTNGWGAFMFHADASGKLFVGTDLANRITLPAGNLTLNTWQHFVFTYSSLTGTSTGMGQLYRNGQLLQAKADMARPVSWDGLSIGSATLPSSFFNGQLDELRVYNRALTDPEVQQLTQCRPTPPQLSLCPPLRISSSGDATIAAGGSTTLQATASVAGNMLTFDGVDDNVEITNRDGDPRMVSKGFATTNNFTLEAWVLPTATHTVDPEMTQYAGLSGGQRWAFSAVHGGLYYGGEHASTAVSVGTNGVSVYELSDYYYPAVLVWQAPTPLTSWTHVAVVYTNRQPSLYINGQLVKQTTVQVRDGSGNPMSRPYVHPSPNLGGGTYQGSLDEVRVWNVARLAADLTRTKHNVFTAVPSSLIGYWRLDEGTGQVTRDLTNSNNDGYLKGGGGRPGPNGNGPTWTPSTAPLTGVNMDAPLPLTWAPATGLSATTGTQITAAPQATTAYTVQATTGCGTTAQAALTVRVTSNTTPDLVNPPVACAPTLAGTAPPSRGGVQDVVNYVRTYTARQAFTDPAALTSAGVAGVQVKTEYLDGLGRPVQTVLRQESPLGRDLVQPVAYDALGRQAREYLPYVSGGTVAGAYRPDALKEQDDFYRTTALAGPGLAFDNTVRTGVPYTEKQFEASPLNRVVAQTAPGESWSAHPTRTTERPNADADVVARFTAGYAEQGNPLTYQGSYAAGELWLSETTDEDQRRVREFKDKQGQVVAKFVTTTPTSQSTMCFAAGESATLTLSAPTGMVLTGIQAATYGRASGSDCSTMSFDAGCSADVTSLLRQRFAQQLATGTATSLTIPVTNEMFGDPCPYYGKQLRVVVTYTSAQQWLQTYYVYDDFSRLRTVVPPKAAALLPGAGWNLADAEVARLLFRYRYDGRGRLLAKQVPDQDGEQQLVYDAMDRPILTQDAQQRTRSEWSWSKYDALGRVVMTGLVTRNGSAEQLQQQVEQLSAGTLRPYEVRTSTDAHFYSTTQAYPRLEQDGFTNSQVLTVTYYDDYNFNNDAQGTADAVYSTAYDDQFTKSPYGRIGYTKPPVADPRVTGLITRTKTRVLGVAENMPNTASWLMTTTFYDEKARPVQVVSTNARNGEDLVTTQLDFTGKVIMRYSVHTGPKHMALPISEISVYDNAGRFVRTIQQVDGETTSTVIAEHSYNELGQLTRKTLSPNTSLQQQVDYTYNVRGWLRGLNEDLAIGATTAAATTDLWGLQLSYDCGFQVPQYNGNISGQQWRSKADGVPRAYGYLYDPSNRLIRGDYVAQSTAGSWSNERQHYNLGVRYDENGNLQRLVRHGLLTQASAEQKTASQFGRVDQLAYRYQGNRLLAVDDSITANVLPVEAGSAGALRSLAGDFVEKNSSRQTGQLDYTYDANGSLTQDLNKGITRITYNHLNLPVLVKFTDQDYIEFRYTASGQKVAKVVYQAGKSPVQTDYLNGYQYEGDSLRFFAHAEGRMLRFVSPASGQVRYEREFTLKDHLGNLRLAYRKGSKASYVATMEMTPAEKATQEEQQWEQGSVSATRTSVGQQARTGSYVAKLNASAGQPIGPMKLLPVHKGDTLVVRAPGYYPQPISSGSTYSFSLLSFVSQLLNQQPTPTPTGDGRQKLKPLPFLGLGLAVIPQLQQTGRVPKGYVRLLTFNQDRVLLASQTRQLSELAATGYEELQLSAVAQEEGYMEVYMGNESEVDVLFDDVQLDYKPALLVQENEYDPWGLNLAGIEQKANPDNKFQYNSKEKQEDFNLNWLAYGARMYDRQTGKFNAVDMKAGNYLNTSPYSYGLNNPLKFVDIDGRVIGIVDPVHPESVVPYIPGQSPPENASPFVVQAWKSIDHSYNSGDVNAKDVINSLVNSREFKVEIKKNSRLGVTGYLNHKLDYNPFEGLLVGKDGGGRQSPATGLYHELFHSFQHMTLINNLKAAEASGNQISIDAAEEELYDFENNKDIAFRDKHYEQPATQAENGVARARGESQRGEYNDNIGAYRTNGHTSTEPNSPTKKDVNNMAPVRREFYEKFGF